MCWNRNNDENKTNKQKETTRAYFRGPSCWIIKHEILISWPTFYFFPFCFCFCFSFFPFFSLFLFLSPFLSFSFFFLAEYWGGPSRPCRPACYALDLSLSISTSIQWDGVEACPKPSQQLWEQQLLKKLYHGTCGRWCTPSKVSWIGIIVCGRPCEQLGL